MHALHLGRLGPLVAPLLIALWTLRGPMRQKPWPAFAAIVGFGWLITTTALDNIRAPYEWDFGCFWLYGHIAAAHRDIYDPAVFAHFPTWFSPSAEFVQAVINVGFPYPPPTIALFLPLGVITSVSLALTLWYVVQFAALVAAACFLARYFMPDHVASGAALIVAIVLTMPATRSNVQDAQTNFLLLLLLALALGARDTRRGGVWQMLAVWIKPYSTALLLLDVIRGNRRTLVGATLTAAVTLAGAALFLGPHVFLRYFRSGPAGREPSFAFVESVNQSLLAVVLRAKHAVPAHVSLLHEPEYVVASLLLIAVTVALSLRVPRNSDAAFASFLLLGMIVYPATLVSYGVAFVIPLLVLWAHREAFPGKAAFVVGMFTVVAILESRMGSGSNFHFAATLALWFATVLLLLLQARGAGAASRVAAVSYIGPEQP